MNAIVFLLLALVVASLGSAAVYLRQRQPASVESGIDSFRRGMRALADSQDQ